MRFHSIRTRLTLWYAAILFAGFGFLGVCLWLSLNHALTRSVDEEVERSIESFNAALDGGQHVSDRHIQQELDEFAQPKATTKLIQIYDPALRTLFSPSSFDGPRQLRSSAKPGGAFAVIQWNGASYRVLTKTMVFGQRTLEVTVADSLAPAQAILRGVSWLCGLISPFVVLLACFGGWWLSGRALAPVQEMTRAAKLISIHNLSEKLKVPDSDDEIQDLAETWNQTLERLQGAVSRLNQFTADASHELRSPVAYIRATAELSLRRDRSAYEYRDALMRIEAESKRMTDLIQDLLVLARWDAEPADHVDAMANLASVVFDVSEHMAPAAEAKGVEISIDVPERPVIVEGDEQSLRRLLLILTDNAVKYSTADGRIQIALRQDENSTELSVSDTGIGIPEADMSRIFDRFYRVSRARTYGEGSGLGLALARHIATAHGAEIRAVSHTGDGSKFIVKFERNRGGSMLKGVAQ